MYRRRDGGWHEVLRGQGGPGYRGVEPGPGRSRGPVLLQGRPNPAETGDGPTCALTARTQAWVYAHMQLSPEEAAMYKNAPVVYNADLGFFFEPNELSLLACSL